MNDQTPHLLRRLIPGLLFGFLVFLALVLIGDLKEISGEFKNFNWLLYPLVLLLTLINYLLRFIKWHYYLMQLGINDLPLMESARLFLAGFPLAVTPGKAGEALKAVWLEQRTGLPVARGISVVTAERISDGLAVLILSTLGVVAYPRYWPLFAAALFFVTAVIIISQVRPLATHLIQWMEVIPLLKRFTPAVLEFYEGSHTLFKLRQLITAVSLGTISWAAEGVGMYLVLIGLGIKPGWNTLSIAIFVLAFSTVIGAVSALPGGLGAAEASLAGMLSYLLATGGEIATTATILIRFATLWFAVAIGLGVWLISRDLFQTKTRNG